MEFREPTLSRGAQTQFDDGAGHTGVAAAAAGHCGGGGAKGTAQQVTCEERWVVCGGGGMHDWRAPSL